MISRRKVLTLLSASATLALPALALAGPPRTPPGQGGGGPPGQADKNNGGGPGNGKGKNHKNGQALVADKIKQNGNHKLETVGKVDVSADISNGKVVGFHAKHADKGELKVGKVKSMQKFAALEQKTLLPGEVRAETASLVTVWYYAYWFTDEFGNDYYYWFPVDYIVDDGSWFIYSA